jgi:hypothetical protein
MAYSLRPETFLQVSLRYGDEPPALPASAFSTKQKGQPLGQPLQSFSVLALDMVARREPSIREFIEKK